MTDKARLDRSAKIVQSNPRHGICVLFDGFLDVILAEQKAGNSNVGEAMRLEYGESLAAGIMQAAHLRKMRLDHEKREKQEGTQKSTGASDQ